MFPDVTTRIVDRRPGRLEIGQADGIQARSVETFQAFGFAERIVAEAYWQTEMVFWKPDPADPSRIVRSKRTPDDPAGVSEFPHLLVNQARVLDYFAEFAANAPTRMQPDYGYEFEGLEVADDGEYPVTVTLVHTAGEREGQRRTVRAKYVMGADGARSRVRAAIGCHMAGDQANHAWGVMDVLAVTDFPDIRTKCSIQSEAGSILLIPREGGYLFRMYVDLGEVAPDDHHHVRQTTIEQIIARANEILHPYTLDVKNVAWHSVYEVGHRLTDRFDDVPTDAAGSRTPRVFIAGDACHTHSAKAGQGMNVSIQDGWNIGWKLGHVLEGRAPESLLATYSAERQVVAQNLIDFDKQWSTMMAKKPEEFASPVGARGVLRADLRVPRRLHDPVRPVAHRRRGVASGARDRLPDRQAVQVRAGRAGVRRQPAAPRPPGDGRRPVAHLRVRRRRTCRRGIRRREPRRVARDLTRLADRRDARRRRPRRVVRREGDLPAGPHGCRPQRRARRFHAAHRSVRAHRPREGVRRRPGAGHLRGSGHRPGRRRRGGASRPVRRARAAAHRDRRARRVLPADPVVEAPATA